MILSTRIQPLGLSYALLTKKFFICNGGSSAGGYFAKCNYTLNHMKL